MEDLLKKLLEAVELGKCNKIRADFYSPDPQGAVNYLKQLVF